MLRQFLSIADADDLLLFLALLWSCLTFTFIVILYECSR